LLGECSEKNCDLKNGCIHAVHAEENAISFAAKKGISLDGAILYCTSCPCYDCAKLIAQSGIDKVIYHDEYRDDKGKFLLQSIGITVIKHE
jgi:dCMP deaminase